MMTGLEQANQLLLEPHKEPDKNKIRNKGENALYTKLRNLELKEVKTHNEKLEKLALDGEISSEELEKNKRKAKGLAYGVMKIHDYVEMLKAEIEQEDIKNQQ